jgi:hypothetical protein
LIDYKEYAQKKKRIQRFISHPAQKASFLIEKATTGEMKINVGKSYQILIEVSDYNGNTSYIEAYITGVETTENGLLENNFLDSHKDYLFDFETKEVYFPKNSFFDSIPLTVKTEGKKLLVGENNYPLQKPFEVRYKIPIMDSLISSQSFIAMLDSKGKPNFFSNQKKEGFWIGKSKILGTFTISRDSVAPSIKPLNFKNEQWLSTFNYLRLKLSDDYSGIKTFRGEINGRWIRLEHEPKNNTLIYNFNDLKFEQALHHLTIEAEDRAGNNTKLEMDFYRKSE